MVSVCQWPGRPRFNPRLSPKTQKMILDATLLNTQYYKVRSRLKWSNPGKGVAPSLKFWCNSYQKGSLRVTLNYSHQLYFTLYTEIPKRLRKWSLFNVEKFEQRLGSFFSCTF